MMAENTRLDVSTLSAQYTICNVICLKQIADIFSKGSTTSCSITGRSRNSSSCMIHTKSNTYRLISFVPTISQSRLYSFHRVQKGYRCCIFWVWFYAGGVLHMVYIRRGHRFNLMLRSTDSPIYFHIIPARYELRAFII